MRDASDAMHSPRIGMWRAKLESMRPFRTSHTIIDLSSEPEMHAGSLGFDRD